MRKTLLRLQFKAMAASWMGKTRKKSGKGSQIFLALVFVYLGVLMLAMFGYLFQELVIPYHLAGLDWLYFAMAGTMSVALAVFGSVFSTQNQLYESKDNALLLSMPIAPGDILLCRMVPLLALNLLFSALAMAPAGVVYGWKIGFSVLGAIGFGFSFLTLPLVSQAIACLLGWGLHLMLSKLNKSLASVIYTVLFLAIYFGVYSQASQILQAMAMNGSAIAGVMQSWIWPLYAMGRGCVGGLEYLASFVVIAAGLFLLAYWFLSRTFLQMATMRRSIRQKKAIRLETLDAGSPMKALHSKELKRFLSCPVYLTNMGLGLILMVVLTVAGGLFRNTVMELLEAMNFQFMVPLILFAMLGFLVSTNCISTPSVSLEGKNLWILRAMPLSSRQVLLGKLGFHCVMTLPLTAICGAVLAVIFGCSAVNVVLLAVVPTLLALFNGVFGLICGLQWARLDWISEAYPCKQSVSVLVVMMTTMLVPIGLAVLFIAVCYDMSPELFLLLVGLAFTLVDGLLLWLLLTWGAKKWDVLI